MKVSGTASGSRLATAFAFRSDLVRLGDVLLCTNSGDKISGAIRTVTGGTFSHAAICTKPPLFIEADFSGVTEFSLQRKLVANPARVRLLRLKQSLPNAAAVAAAAAEAALRYQTGRYDKIAAMASVLGGFKAGSGLFCSFVVSAAYQLAGLNVTSDGKHPAATTPADLEYFEGFDIITKTHLRGVNLDPHSTYWFVDRAPQYAIGEPDQGEAPSPAQLYNIALRKVGERVSLFLRSKGCPEVGTYLDAQNAIALYRNELWFDELDVLFADSIRELALPEVVQTVPLVSEARHRDAVSLGRSLANPSLGERDVRIYIAEMREREATTIELIKDRSETIRVFQIGRSAMGWKVYTAWLECEAVILDNLTANLASYRDRIEIARRHAHARGWTIE